MRKPSTLAIMLVALAAGIIAWLWERPTSVSAPAATIAPRMAHASPITPPPNVAAAPQSGVKDTSIEDFAAWLHRYDLATPAQRLTMQSEGKRLALARREQLYRVIASDPERALQSAVPESSRQVLPPAITDALEQPVSARGELAAMMVESATARQRLGGRTLVREARFGEQHFDAYVYGRRAKQDTKYGTSLIGITIGDRMAVLDAPARVLSASELPAKAKLQSGIEMDHHTLPAQNAPIVETGGEYHPVCCEVHAMQLVARALAAESQSGHTVEAMGGTVAASTASAPAAGATGAQSMLVIVVDFPDKLGTPQDITNSNASMTSSYISNRISTEVSAFLDQSSYGKVSIGSVSVTSLLHLTSTLASYASSGNSAKLKSDALAAASGSNPSSFDHVGVVFANTNDISGDKFNWTGLADLGGNFTWYNGGFSLALVSHELQHNFGMRHANLWQIPAASTDPVDPLGSSDEYGDPFDVMGSGPGDATTQPSVSNPWFLNRVHWLADSAVQTIDTSGTYRVYRYDHKAADMAKTLALKLARSSTTDYWIGHRRKYVGHPTLSDISSGAYILWGYHDNVQSSLIDIDTPGNTPSDASLNVGNTFNDTAAGVSFTVSAAGGSGTEEYLDVNVAFKPRIVFQSPAFSVDEQAGSVNIVIERRNNSAGVVSFHYATENGSATAGSDYTAVSGDHTWVDGDATPFVIPISITSDAATEGAETFSIKLTSITGAVTPEGSTATVTIQESGALDTTYTPVTLNSWVRDIAPQSDGKSVIVGGFPTGDSITSAGVARLDSEGTLDAAFDQGVGVNNALSSGLPDVRVVVRQPDGKVLIGGEFTTLRSFTSNRIARLNSDGTFDSSFNAGTGPNKVVNAIVVQPDGKLLVGGAFSTWNGSARPGVVRLNEDGSLDASFVSFDNAVDAINGTGGISVSALALQPIASALHFRVIVTGLFDRPFSSGGFHSGIVALSAVDGSRDTTFDAPIGAHAGASNDLRQISCVAVQPDGKIIVGGQFTGFGGVGANRLARLTSTGANDSSFISNLGGGITGSGFCEVSSIALQGDSKIVVAGHFSTAGGQSQACLARFNTSGAFDSLFRPSIPLSSSILGGWKVALQADSRLLVGLNGAGANSVLKRFFSSLAQVPSIIQFATTSATVGEGGSVDLTLQRTGGSLGAVSVNYATVARSATAGSDFTTTTGTLSWADGDSAAKTITVATLGDVNTSEADETLEVRLANPLGGMLLGANQIASVTIQNVDPVTTPHLSFATANEDVSEAAGTMNVTINASPTPTSAITVPFTVTGTATQGIGKDYTMASTSPITFGVGETSKTISVNVLQDALLESTETIVLTLGTPTGVAVLGTEFTHTISILDDELRPGATAVAPLVRIVRLGDSTTFGATPFGNPAPTVQWRKGTSAISGQKTSSYTLNNAQTSSGGSYNLLATSPLGSFASGNLDLGVLDKADSAFNLKVGTNKTLTVNCSSNITGFVWKKDGNPVTDVPGHISGSHSKSLVITKLVNASAGPPIVASDAGVYTCDVTLTTPNGTATDTTGNITINVLDTVPLILGKPITSLPDAIVAGSYDQPISVDTTPNRTTTSFSMSGGPPGLSISTTGHIIGKPNVALTADKTYTLTIRAINTIGYDEIKPTLIVHPVATGTTGAWISLLNRDDDVNMGLGGRLDLSVLSTGIFSGTLVNGATTHSFTNQVLSTTVGSSLSTGTVVIKRTGTPTPPNLTVNFTLNGATNTFSVLTVGDGTHTTNGTGWRNVVPASNQRDLHTVGFELETPDSALPQGTSYASFTVDAVGKFTLTGKLADGVGLSTAGHIGPNGEVLVFQTSATLDAITGVLTVVPGVAADYSDYTITGTPKWSRKAQTSSTARTYTTAFGPVNLTAFGSRYAKPLATEVIMSLPYTAGVTLKNAHLSFTDGDFASPPVTPDVDLLIKPGGASTVLAPKPRGTSFSIGTSTAFFSGTFNCTDTNPFPTPATVTRNSNPYQGLIIRKGTSLKGRGNFLLPKLPSFPGELTSKTPITSGKVVLEVVPP